MKTAYAWGISDWSSEVWSSDRVFDKWVAMGGVELGVKREAEYAVLFFADIMHDGRNEAMRNLPARLLFSGDKPVFIIGAEQYELASERGYRNFWNIYHRPPEQKHRHYLLERRDSLLPMDDQKFKGAFYTPLPSKEERREGKRG